MTTKSLYKRSPTTPSTPSVRNGAEPKKLRRDESSSPTRSKRRSDLSMEDLTRQNIINSREVGRMQDLVKFLELERKFKA
ncbi:LAFA_0A01398g1_1 [Lachancea sp. 'fantastica']|nr:LAFA_0A01398g1_1 [Lachancea sp. 'fantastica']